MASASPRRRNHPLYRLRPPRPAPLQITGNSLTLAFDPLDPDPGPEMSVRLLGVLDNENGHYLARDRFSNSVS